MFDNGHEPLMATVNEHGNTYADGSVLARGPAQVAQIVEKLSQCCVGWTPLLTTSSGWISRQSKPGFAGH